ncbi:MAG: hypothetical protein H7Y32_18890, partial [Chloroflexales bacterium]|nr:hypothetical protein [Chloroflexales bacterium]
DTVDFGRLEGVVQVQIQVTNAGSRFSHVPVVYPPWIAGSPQSIDLQPGDVRQIALNVYPEQIGLQVLLDGAVELRQAQGPVDVPVRARAPLMQRIWWRHPLPAMLTLMAAMVLLIIVTMSIATGRARQQNYEAGVAALERGDWLGSRSAFDELLKDDPNYRDAAALRNETFYRPGEQALIKGDWPAARRELRRIAGYRDADTLLRESYYRPAQTAVREEQWNEAAEQIVRLEALDARYRDLPALLAQRPELNAAAGRAATWRCTPSSAASPLGSAATGALSPR